MKNFVNKLKNKGKELIVLASVIPLLSLAGCNLCNYRPYTIISSHSSYPQFGEVPQYRLQVDGRDLNGQEDIVEYQLMIDREGTARDEIITQSTPIDIIRSFDTVADITLIGTCTDSRSASDTKTATINPQRVVPRN